MTPASNLPDSGVVCAADGGLGMGTLTGADRFTVGSARQALHHVVDNDSGVVTATYLEVSLREDAVPCGMPSPGGSPFIGVTLFDRSGAYGVGDYTAGSQQIAALCACVTAPDGGPGALALLSPGDGGANRIASAGTVHVTSMTACSLGGSFELTFTQMDGGDPRPLSGSFDSTFCP